MLRQELSLLRDREANSRKKEQTLESQLKELKNVNKETHFNINIDENNLEKMRDTKSFLLRDIQSLIDNLRTVETSEIGSLNKIIDEQRIMVSALNDEKDAFTRHLRLLEEQNKKLIGELETQVQTSELLKQKLDKRERVCELKERMITQKH